MPATAMSTISVVTAIQGSLTTDDAKAKGVL